MKCDHCQMLSIQGMACHETGCPNSKKTWDEDRERWIAYRDCFTCGYPIEVGTECSCQDTDEDTGVIESYEEDSQDEDLTDADYIEDLE